MGKTFKAKEWRTPNRMLFESGYRTFDRAVDVIAAGNVVSSVQLSTNIRKMSDTNGNPEIGPGQCRMFDLRMFAHRGVPETILDYIRVRPDEEFWLYLWHLPGRGSEYGDAIGWILTDKGMENLLVRVCGWHRKSRLVLEEAEKYVVKGDWK